MTVSVPAESQISLDGAARLRRMIRRAGAGGDLRVRLRFDPLSPSVFGAVLVEGDTSQVLLFAEIDEEADAVPLVARQHEPDDAPRARRRDCMGAFTYPDPFTIASRGGEHWNRYALASGRESLHPPLRRRVSAR